MGSAKLSSSLPPQAIRAAREEVERPGIQFETIVGLMERAADLVAAMAAPEVQPAGAVSAAGAQPSFIGFAMASIAKRKRKSPERIDSGQLPLFAA